MDITKAVITEEDEFKHRAKTTLKTHSEIFGLSEFLSRNPNRYIFLNFP